MFDLSFDRTTAFANLDEADLAYLQVIPPSWMKNDSLMEQVRQLAHLYLEGKVVWGCIVQANRLLWSEDESISCPAEVLYDPTGQADIETLQEVAHQLYLLKDTIPDDPTLRKYAKHITNEYTRLVGYDVPDKITPLPLKSTGMFIWRLHLPNGVLQQVFPILVSDKTGEITVLPSKFWSKELYENWINNHYYKADMYSGVRQLYAENNVWKKHKRLFRPTAQELQSIHFSDNVNTKIDTKTSIKQPFYDERLTSKGFVYESLSMSIEDRKSQRDWIWYVFIVLIVFILIKIFLIF